MNMATRSIVPPVARRKRQMAERRRRQQNLRDMLLGMLALVMIIGFFFYNIRLRRAHRFQQPVSSSYKSHLRGGGRIWITPESQPFNQDSVATAAHHLIVVAGHSVVIAGNLDEAGYDESVWFLLDYQKGRGMPQAIFGHIQAGINEAHRDPNALLVFSGGQTRPATGPLSEGGSYFQVADAMNLWPSGSTVRARTVAEEFATDSFENLLFSICRFREVTGRYPTKITMVSFTFKQTRFETMHVPALQWPEDRFKYVGVDPDASTGFDLAQSTKGELENAAKPFTTDPYGCHSPVLQDKRKGRNPFHRTSPYTITCPEIKPLLQYCGPNPFPKESLPWATAE